MIVEMSRRIVGLSLLVLLALLYMRNVPVHAQTEHWARFHDPETGLSFRYPSNLRVRRRDPRHFNLPALQSVVELIGDTPMNPGTVVLRFLVRSGHLAPSARAGKLKQLRTGCKSTSSMMIDGHDAIVCVFQGSAATRWSVEILEPRECTIVTLLGGADADQASPPPHDAEFPLLSIIRTVHFTATPGSASQNLNVMHFVIH